MTGVPSASLTPLGSLAATVLCSRQAAHALSCG
uniref:Uncharacterized protein n=1 Tax=Burkholderia sp. (strain CCGE1003) TaxID=640512 RepID=E1TKD2_BURSG